MPSTLGIVDSHGRGFFTEVIYVGSGSPYGGAYKWSPTGFGTRYSNFSRPFDNTGAINALDISSDGKDIVMGAVDSPYIAVLPWSSSTGFGTKYANPSTALSSAVRGVAFNKTKTVVSAVNATSPYIHSYAWSNGFGTKYSDPAVALSVSGDSVAFMPNNNAILASGFDTSNNLEAWAWSDTTGFGTKYSNAAVTYIARRIKISPTGSDVFISNAVSIGPPLAAWPWSDSTGFGTKYSNPSSYPTVIGYDVAVSPGQTAVAVGVDIDVDETIGLYAYSWQSGVGFGTKYTAPSGFDNRSIRGVDFSSTGTDIVAVEGSSPYIHAIKWFDNSGFGTKYSNPGTASSNGLQVKFVPIH